MANNALEEDMFILSILWIVILKRWGLYNKQE